MRRFVTLATLTFACTTAPSTAPDDPDPTSLVPIWTPLPAPSVAPAPVTMHHNSLMRDGLYVVPGLTRQVAAQKTHLVTSFDGHYAGAVNAQPLYVPGASGRPGAYFVVTETNDVVALDEETGLPIWTRSLGSPATAEGEGCGGLNPLGVTGTPVIDPSTRTLYVDGVSAPFFWQGAWVLKTHLVHALSIDDGSEREGWPVDVSGLSSNGNAFDVAVAHQRGALALVGSRLYVPYGSQGDCGSYRGTVVSIDTVAQSRAPSTGLMGGGSAVTAWMAPGLAAGVWSPNGVASEGKSVFFATGNGSGSVTLQWEGGEAVYRFSAGPMKDAPDDVFVADNWHELDMVDGDLGGSGATIIEQPGAPVPELAIALGKDGNLYAIDTADMGGMPGVPPLILLKAATHDIVDAPAAVPYLGGTLLVFDTQSGGSGVGCPGDEAGDLVGVLIMPGSPPTASVLWCASGGGNGSPIITTTDGSSEPIVWLTGGGTLKPTSTNDNGMRAYDATTGDVIYDATTQGVSMPGMYRFNTLIVANQRIVVAANDRAFQFAFQ